MNTDSGKLVYGDQDENKSVTIQGVRIEFVEHPQAKRNSHNWMRIITYALVTSTETPMELDVINDQKTLISDAWYRWFEGRLQIKGDKWKDVKETLKVAVTSD